MSTRGDDSSSVGTNDDLPNSEDELERRKIMEAIERRKATEQLAKIDQAPTSAATSNNDDQARAKKVAQPVVKLLPRIAEPPGTTRTEEEAEQEGGEEEEEEEEVRYFTFNWHMVLEPEIINASILVHSPLFTTNYQEITMCAQAIHEPCQNCATQQKQEAWHLHLYCWADSGGARVNLSDKFEFGMATRSRNTFSFCQLDKTQPIFQGKISLAHEPGLASGTKIIKIQCRLPDANWPDRTSGDLLTKSISFGVHNFIYENYFDLLQSGGEYSDVTIECGDYEFKAHQHILAAASLELRRLFDEAPKDQPLESIVIKNMHVRTFQILLKCIYTGRVEGLRERFSEYIVLAQRFQIPSLVRICNNFVKIVLKNAGFVLVEPIELVERRSVLSGPVIDFVYEYELLCREAELAKGSLAEKKLIQLYEDGWMPRQEIVFIHVSTKENKSNADADGNAADSTDSDQPRDAAAEEVNPIEKRKQNKYKKVQKKPPQLSAIDEARASVEREAARQVEEDAKKEPETLVEQVPAPEPGQAQVPPPESKFVPIPTRRTKKQNKRQAKKNK